ncbi:MAG: 2-oxoglutarate dehydrogenase complex dihydrolipoyllysine-residue succinyltransferase [Gammaproteobacteria bacterium]|nr:2-oxoglutarate dehydrogenase complex dihydrolipoyllysine-residue succinyltransferase [Gammaproteobacteria bacterium]
MLVEVKVPQLAESVTEATLLDWQKQQGERVARGDNLIDIETDKVVLEITAADSGVLKEIRKNGGDVSSNEVIAIIDTEASAGGAANDASAKNPPPAAELQPASKQRAQTAPSVSLSAQSSTSAAATRKDTVNGAPGNGATRAAGQPGDDDDKIARLGPAVRKLLNENSLRPNEITATGKDGRVTKADVLARVQSRSSDDGASQASTAVQSTDVEEGVQGAALRTQQRVPMTRLRKRVAERLLQAQRDNAILTTFNEVDMQPILKLRERYRDKFEKTHGVRLGFTAFFVLASIEALRRFPVVNASIDQSDLIYHGFFDIGIAVGSARGLVVPILRDADRLSMAAIEKAVADFGRKANDNSLTLEELTGGTFTITNGGVFGSMLSTPILNPPQSAILGMHKIEERPIAMDGKVAIRPMMYLALSYDHRIIDGREAVQFLVTIKEQLEDPSRLLLQI